MTRIFKYPLLVIDEPEVIMPEGAKILCVQTQYDQPVLWALVDDAKPLKSKVFRIVGTGRAIDFETEGYVGTFQVLEGGLVFHVFEKKGH